jgi:deoxycytidylate deaminase
MITKTERSFFNAAKSVSELSDHRHKLGCVVVLGHRIISSGRNSKTKCHKVQALMDKAMFGCESFGPVHAEVDALLPLIRKRVDLSRASLYIYREHKDGSTALAHPCARCMKLIKECGIKKIHYSTNDGYAVENVEL